MVRPAAFGYNEETAANNTFMRRAKRLSPKQIVERAVREFDGMVAALRTAGVEVLVVRDSELPLKPDAVFPNNWFSTHGDGTLITYPMYAPTRRAERDNPVVPSLSSVREITRRIRLEGYEREEQFLEGTGSLILDRVNRVAYACTSERTHSGLAARWASLMDYELVLFGATDEEGVPVYHTNVIMAIGSTQVVICLESVNAADRDRVRARLAESGRAIIDISFAQVKRFAGNMLEVVDGGGLRRWAMSTQAHGALSDLQRQVLSLEGPIIHSDIEAIEQLGGGSARCMIAEVYLPRRSE